MNKLCAILALLSLTLCASLSTLAADRPCKPITEACMKEGYYKDGAKVGKGLVKDCLMPVVAKTKVLPNTNFSDAMLQACKDKLANEMKTKGK